MLDSEFVCSHEYRFVLTKGHRPLRPKSFFSLLSIRVRYLLNLLKQKCDDGIEIFIYIYIHFRYVSLHGFDLKLIRDHHWHDHGGYEVRHMHVAQTEQFKFDI